MVEPKRILVTGGAGFLGSHLCEHFLSKGHHVTALDNFVTGSQRNVEHLSGKSRFKLVQHDISRPYESSEMFDAILHFASPASPSDYMRLPLETLEAGSSGTRHCLELARLKKAVFLMASTSEVYGDPLERPQAENYRGNVNPVGPRSVYDEAKRFSEALTMAYHRYHQVDTKIVRIFNTYGPRMGLEDGRVIPNFITQALLDKPLTVYGDGSQTRSYCYAADLVAGIEKLLFSKIHEPVNLGNPTDMTVRQLADVIIQMTGSKSLLAFEDLPVDDPKVRCPDITKARRQLGWEPRVSLEEGLGQTISYFRAQLARK